MRYANERERGCGQRIIGGYYLVSDEGTTLKCDLLPVKIESCSCCGYWFQYGRSITVYHAGFLAKHFRTHVCKDKFPCPLCSYAKTIYFGEEQQEREPVFFMYVSDRTYTKEAFRKEARYMGVSKRIAPHTIPKKFKLGENWIFLITNKDEPEIFYAFKPSRIEVVLDKQTTKPEKILELEEKGYTVVLVDSKEKKKKRKAAKQ